MYELSTVSRCVGKTKALLAAKRSPVCWGSQMCLSVRWVSFSSLSLCSKFFTVVLSFYACAQRLACMCSSGLEAPTCPFGTKFLRSTDLRFTTSPAIATYTLLPPVLPCLPWFVGLFDATFFIVFCRAVGQFLKFLFLLGW